MWLLDRYVLRGFVSTLVFSVLALVVIFVIVDLLESLDDFLDHGAPFMVILRYYLAYIPAILELLMPIGTLLASLFSVGRMGGANEITAMRAGGQGLVRFMVPLVLFGIVLSAVQIWFNGWVVPRANTEKLRIERVYMGRSNQSGSLYNLAFRDTPTRNVLIGFYDGVTHHARNVSLEEFGSAHRPRIVRRVDAADMDWDTLRRRWIVKDGVERRFAPDTVLITPLHDYVLPFSLGHEQIIRIQKNVDELTFDELEDHITTLRLGGKETRRQEIDLAGQWALPWANTIVILIAVPFASVRRRGGIAVNIAMAMAICFVYIAITKIIQAVGAATPVPVEAVAWCANVLFFLIGCGILLRTRS